MNVQYLNVRSQSLSSLRNFKSHLESASGGVAEINVTDTEGTRHTLKINPKYMGGGFAYFLTHTGMGRQQMKSTTLEELVKEGGIIDTFLKDAGVSSSGGRRKTRKTKRNRKGACSRRRR